MFDLGTWGELLIIVAAFLVLIGPKELPTVLRTLGRWVQKFRKLSSGLRAEFESHLHEGEFEEYQNQINQAVLEDDKKKPSKKSTTAKKRHAKKQKKD